MIRRLGGILVVLGALGQAQAQVLVQKSTSMVYQVNTSDPGIGIAWTAKDYPNTWPAGTYGVGYDTSNPTNPLLETFTASQVDSVYTRAEFIIADVSAVETLFLGADWDDGYIAWVNGVEVYRSPQMPDAVTLPVPAWNTDASLHESSNSSPPDYGELINISAAAIPVLEDGTNVLAVGVWNGSLPSSDLILVPLLHMNLPGPDPRGPYLQMGSSTSTTVRWRTDALADSRVRYGPAPGNLDQTLDDTNEVFVHEMTLTGLDPDTVYYYEVGTTAGDVFAGGDADHFFRTSPPLGTRRPIRIWAIGDSGTANANAEAVRDAYATVSAGEHTDLWLMLGDNAYPNGTDGEYQAAVFDMYPDLLRRSVLWSTLGNHDAVASSTVNLSGPYYDSFTFHSAELETSGSDSGTEAYYSFDFGNIHFVCLNSQETAIKADMLTWLEDDLMNTAADWIVAFFHHPPYSKGSHDSDDVSDSSGRLFTVRQEFLPLLEAGGVDLVLTGHSHSYERSFLLDGHYGTSGEIVMDPSLKLDPGDGRLDGDGAYEKATAGPAAHEGAVYVVAGSSGRISGGSLDHPAMFLSLNELGSLILDVNGHRLDGTFLNSGVAVRDTFTLVKDTGTLPAPDFTASPVVGPAPLDVDFTDLSTTNTSGWSWDLDGDAIADSLLQHPSRSYPTPGFYTVSLTAANMSGAAQETKAAFVCVSEGVPAEVADLGFFDQNRLLWSPLVAADRYDIVQGDLGALTGSGGDYTASVTTCLENDDTDETAVAPGIPARGEGFYYLVRGLSLCDEAGTYDTSGAGQADPRDAEIASAPAACS